MKLSRLFPCVITLLISGSAHATQHTPYEAASSFLPPGTRIADLQRFDPKTGKPTESTPAVFAGHFVSPNSSDIVFACINKSQDPETKSLFVIMLHKVSESYSVVFEKSYFERFLWVQDFNTVGLKILKLPGETVDSVAIATARGASLGVQVELYHWVDGLGMTNVMPSHPPAHQISFLSEDNHFTLKLSFEKYPGEKGAPQPMLFRWNGHQLTPLNS